MNTSFPSGIAGAAMASPGEPDRAWTSWLPALGLVAVLHVAVWWGLSSLKSEPSPPKPLAPVEVTLVAPRPPEPRPEPPPPPPPKVVPKQQPLTRPAPVAAQPQPVAPEPVALPVADAPSPVQAAVVAPPAPPAPAPKPVEPVVEPPRFDAAYLSNPKPAYPLAARRRGIEGRVLLRVEVAAGGEALQVQVKKGSGHDMLDQAAVEAVRKWHFVPAKRGNTAVAAWVEVPMTFKLDE